MKDILIFSDGTGQIGGVRPNQTLSNVYKLYRAMRPGQDSPIDPAVQIAFYDPGLGSGLGGGNLLQRIRNVLSSAFGTGISENIVDCYEAIRDHDVASIRWGSSETGLVVGGGEHRS